MAEPGLDIVTPIEVVEFCISGEKTVSFPWITDVSRKEIGEVPDSINCSWCNHLQGAVLVGPSCEEADCVTGVKPYRVILIRLRLYEKG